MKPALHNANGTLLNKHSVGLRFVYTEFDVVSHEWRLFTIENCF